MAEMKSLGQLFKDSWDLYTGNFRQIAMFSILMTVLAFALIGGVLLIFFGGAIAYVLTSGSLAEPLGNLLEQNMGWFWVLIAILVIIAVVLSVICYTALIYLIYRLSQNKKVTINESLKYSLGKFKTSLGTMLLCGIMTIGLLLLLIVPGIIFSIYWTFIWTAIVIKDLSGKQALDYSKSIVKDRWWRTLWFGIVFNLAVFIACLIISAATEPLGITGQIIYYLISAPIGAFVYVPYVLYSIDLEKTKSASAKPSKKKK